MAGLVNQILRGLGAEEVDLTSNGVEAVQRLNRETYDLVICDIAMEAFNGLQLLAAVRAGLTKADKDLPVIMLTGHTEDPMIEASRMLKANAFLGKPVSAADLMPEINRVFSMPVPFEAPPVDKEAAYHAIEAARAQLRAEERALGLDSAAINQAEAGLAGKAQSSTQQEGRADVEDIQVGHVLAADVTALNGQKLLSSGTALDNKQVELLQRDGAKLGITSIRVRT